MKKIFNRLTFYSLFAITAGIGVMAAFSLVLALYAETDAPIAPTATPAAQQALHFPENEQMLKEVSSQLVREGAALSTIEPAAGGGKNPSK